MFFLYVKYRIKMATSSKEAKVASILKEENIPSSSRKVSYLWQKLDDIREVKGKIHSCKSIAPRNGDLNFGNLKTWSIPKGKFISNPVLKLQFTGTTSVVSPDLVGLSCIEKIQIYHNQLLIEYNGEDLAHILFHYAPDETTKGLIYTQLGGTGATLAATTYTLFVPIFTGLTHPSQIMNRFAEPYYTSLMNSTLDIYVYFKSAANTFTTPDTVTAFTLCNLYYQDFWGEETELQILKTQYKRFVYDIKYIRQSIAFTSGQEKSIDISSVSNDNVQIHDQIFQLISDTNWSTNKQYNLGSALTKFRLNVSGSDWYVSSDASETVDYTNDYVYRYGKKSVITASATSYFYVTDPWMHEKADDFSNSTDELIVTPAVKMNQMVPTLYITIGSTATFWFIMTCLRRRILTYNGNFIEQKFQ